MRLQYEHCSRPVLLLVLAARLTFSHLLIRHRVDIRPIAERPAWSGFKRVGLGRGQAFGFSENVGCLPTSVA